MKLKNKNAIVTGGARGIGKAIIKKFLMEGAKVVFCDINEKKGYETEKELLSVGEVHFIKADVSNEMDVHKLIDFALDVFKNGRIDILVNNAGICNIEPFLTISLENWRKIIDVNLTGTFLVSRECAKIMKEQKFGSIINISSTNGILGQAGEAHYNASKAGIILLSKTMAIELAEFGIRVNSVCPGLILTDLTKEIGRSDDDIKEYLKKIPLSRYGTPEDVANLCLFLASDDSSFITGTEIVIDGGQISKE